MVKASLFLFLFVISCIADSATVSTKSGPTSVETAAKKSRKVASETDRPYNCAIEVTSQSGTTKQVAKLDGEYKFAGTDAHQEITLFSKQGRQGMTVNAFFKDISDHYIVDNVSCDESLGCEATRTKYVRKQPTKSALEILQGPGGNAIVLGNQVIFRITKVTNGFKVESIQLEVPEQKPIGVQATCTTL